MTEDIDVKACMGDIIDSNDNDIHNFRYNVLNLKKLLIHRHRNRDKLFRVFIDTLLMFIAW